MNTFICDRIGCVHMDTFEGRCAKDTLDIPDFDFAREHCDEAPKCYEDYLETPEYRQEFWMAVRDPQSGKICRKRSTGKRIGINGIDLFTRERIPPAEALQNLMDGDTPYIKCTEARTGYAVRMNDVFMRPELIQKVIDGLPDVMHYPEMMEAETNE